MNSSTLVADRATVHASTPDERATRAVTASDSPDYVVDVSRPVLPWRWTSLLVAPLEVLALVWSIPFVILLIGIPIALLVAVLHGVGVFFLR